MLFIDLIELICLKGGGVTTDLFASDTRITCLIQIIGLDICINQKAASEVESGAAVLMINIAKRGGG